jgi:hypothetical protein
LNPVFCFGPNSWHYNFYRGQIDFVQLNFQQMKKLLFLLIVAGAFACGDGKKTENEADTKTEENSDRNSDETVAPDTTSTQNDTTDVNAPKR